jgi:hypothetical protein
MHSGHGFDTALPTQDAECRESQRVIFILMKRPGLPQAGPGRRCRFHNDGRHDGKPSGYGTEDTEPAWASLCANNEPDAGHA